MNHCRRWWVSAWKRRILQAAVPILDDDTPDTLAARILVQEHKIYPRAVQLFAEGRLRVEGRRVFIEAGKPEGEVVISPF